MLNKLFIISVSSALLSSCSYKSDDAPNIRRGLTESDVAFLTSTASVENHIPDASSSKVAGISVGQLLFVIQAGSNEYVIEACTAFLIAPTIIATNAHCHILDPKVTQRTSTLSDLSCPKSVVIFPQIDNYPSETIACSRVIFSQIGPNKNFPDFAFIELRRPSQRPTLTFTSRHWSESDELHIISVNPSIRAAPFVSSLVQRDCSYNPSLSQNRSSFVKWVSGCDVRSGNSGSPVLNSSNKVVGVLSLLGDTSAENRKFWDKNTPPGPQGGLTPSDCLNSGVLKDQGALDLVSRFIPKICLY